MGRRATVETQARALEVLALACRAEDGVTVRDVVDQLGVSRLTAGRWLRWLAEHVPGVSVEGDPSHAQRQVWTVDHGKLADYLGLR